MSHLHFIWTVESAQKCCTTLRMKTVKLIVFKKKYVERLRANSWKICVQYRAYDMNGQKEITHQKKNNGLLAIF